MMLTVVDASPMEPGAIGNHTRVDTMLDETASITGRRAL